MNRILERLPFTRIERLLFGKPISLALPLIAVYRDKFKQLFGMACLFSVEMASILCCALCSFEGDEKIAASKYFRKVHETLGIDWLALYREVRNLSRRIK